MVKQIGLGGWVFLVAMAAGGVRAASTPVPTPIPEIPALLSRAESLAEASAVTTNAFPDAATVLLAGIQMTEYQADGGYEQWDEQYIKILTEEGRRAHLVLSSHFTIPYQRGPEDCAIPLVEIIKPDGRVVAIDVAGQSRIMVNPSSMDQNIYNPNEKIISVNVAGLDTGDILHFVMFDRIVQPRMAGTWNGWYGFEGSSPVRRQIAEVRAPKSMPLRSIALKDPVGDTVTFGQREEGDRVIYRWEARDVPQAFPEPNMPPMYMVAQRVLVSTTPDWETVSRWYWDLSEPHYKPDQAILDAVAGVVAGATTEEEKIHGLFTWVAQKIRYMGIIAESTAPGYEPHDVTETFHARHGVCRDKAALLVVMLRAAGIEAFPTLIHNGPRKDTEVPQPYFNHAIVAARPGGGGAYILMDPTDETSMKLLPGYLDNQSYLVATPEGDPLRVSPIQPASQNLVRIDTRGTLRDDGSLIAEARLHFDGVNDNAYRRYFAQARAEDRRRLFESVVKASVPSARVSDITMFPEDLLDTSVPLEVVVAFEADDVLVRGEGVVVLPLPVMGTRVGMVNFILGRTGLRERRYPFVTEMACGIQEQVSISLPAAYEQPESLPMASPVETETHAWRYTSRQLGTQLVATVDFQLKAVEFTPVEYRALKGRLEEIERAYRRAVIYRMPSPPPSSDWMADSDVLIERDDLVFDVGPGGDWTRTRDVRLKILTYGGKKAFSELKVDFNPVWEEVRLERGVVTSPTGGVTEIRPGEINLMHAPWVGAAPRYPAGKTLVAAFPSVAPGSTIDYRIVHEHRGQPFFAAGESLAALNAIGERSITLRGNLAAIRIHSNHMERVAGLVTETGGAAERCWRVTSVPPIPSEGDQPPLWAFAPTLFFSGSDWPDYAMALGVVLDRAASKQRAATAKSDELLRGLSDPWERVRRLRDFVDLNVREAGPGLSELPFSAITPADRTLADGYGNATDRSVLLHALLQAAGFKPSFVVASSLPGGPMVGERLRRAPDSALFETVLVRLDDRKLGLPKGTSVYLGDTDHYAPVGSSPHEGHWMLRIPGGTLEVLQPVKPTRRDVTYDITFATGGDARLTVRQHVFGQAFAQQHRLFSEMPPEERRRHALEMAAEVSQAARPLGDLVTDFSGYPGEIRFEVSVENYGVRDGAYLYFDLPMGVASALRLRADARRTPLLVPARLHETTSVVVSAPGEFQPWILPGAVAFDSLEATWRHAMVAPPPSTTGDGALRLAARDEVWLAPGMIEPDAYPALLNAYRAAQHRRTRMVLLHSSQAVSPESVDMK